MTHQLERLTQALADRYRIERELGSGGMATVYLAQDLKHERNVAVKVLRPELAAVLGAERFLQEIKVTANLQHPHILPLHDSGEADSFLYYVMPYVEGESLREKLNREKQLSIDDGLKLGCQVADALGSAHRQGIVHRDIKPENILLREGHALVADFGIALAVTAAGGERLTETGLSLGTPMYMSPEQIDGAGVDARSDIYALGVVLFEAATGQPPFEGPTPLAIAVKHQMTAPPDPRALNAEIPTEVAQLILRCLAKDKHERYGSASDLLSELESARQRLAALAAVGDCAPSRAVVSAAVEGVGDLFVAREEELTRLHALLEQAVAGEGRVAFVTGDAGTGKTALISAFACSAEAIQPELVVVSGKCDAHTGTGDPYMPFREILSLLTGDVEAVQAAGKLTAERARRLRGTAASAARSLLETGSDLIGTLVSGTGLLARVAAATAGDVVEWIEELKMLVERKRTVPADTTLQQASILQQTTRVLQAVGGERPLLLVVDDLQWADSGSIDMMFHLGRRIAGSRILLVGAYRPTEVALGREGQRHPLEPLVNEFRSDFGDLLIELDRPEDRRFVDALLDVRPNRIGEVFRDTLVRHTGGHPLFTIELLRNMQEQGWLAPDDAGELVEVSEIDWEAVPARVDAVIAERIGRLPNELRDILRLASVEGEEFTAEVAAQVQRVDPREVVHLLSSELERRHHLVRARGVSRVNGTRVSRYAFQHILFQRHLYGELDDVERPFLHDAVGNALEELHGERSDDVAVQLARHFQEAGVAEKAVDYLYRAGKKAVRVSANEEAVAHFSRALELIPALPEGPERIERELSLQLAIAVPLQWARGFAAPELGRAVVRARELCEQVRDPGQTFAALVQLQLFYATRPDYHLAIEVAEQLSDTAAESDDPLVAIVPNFMPSWPLLNLGRFPEVVESAERAMGSYVPARDGLTAYIYGFEMGVMNLVFGAWARWFLGYPDTARRDMEQAMALAREHGHPHTMAFVLVGACELYWFVRDPAAVDRYTEELAPLAAEKGFVYWQAHAVFYQAERLVREGRVEDGIQQMHQGIAGMRATGTDTCLTRLNTRMAEACEQAGEYDEAAAAVQAALEIMDRYDERYMEAEIYRHRGTLLLRRGGDQGKVEADFEQAIAIARRQQTKSLELRAVMSLARLWQSHGRGAEARGRLAEIYDWFTEGLDSPDLQDARALLESL
ncbi:MAG: protein kinase [Gemmatimonadota bacterium]|nr:MAG: protein kinase [Gemmatimonadota bacterium]